MAAAARIPLIGRFFGRTVSEGAAYALGVATAPVLAPAVREIQNTVNAAYPIVPPDVGTLAAGVATGQVDETQARAWAAQRGFGEAQFSALVAISDVGPGIGQLYSGWRRGELTTGEFNRGLDRLSIEPEWWPALRSLKEVRLSPEDVANAVQQGFIPEAGLLPGASSGSPPFTIPTETVPIGAVSEAAAAGLDRDRLQVLAQLSGNPPGPMELLDMWNRGIVTEESVDHGIREGRTKTKWAPAIKELRHFLMSPAEVAGLRLRGWIDAAESYRLGALRGASPETMDGLFLNRGRPMTPLQMWRAIRRGDATKADFDRAVKQSDIRPEYTKWEWAIRFTYPSLFQLNRLVTSGAFTVARGRQILMYQGWEETDVDAMVSWWESQGGASGTKWADRARSRLFTVAHNEYLDGSIDDAQAHELLARVGATAGEQTTIVELWTAELGISRLELTPSQIKKAYKKALYTFEFATSELIERGMTAEDANTFLMSG